MNKKRSVVHFSAFICAPLSALSLGYALQPLPGLSNNVSFFDAHIIIPLWVTFSVLFVLFDRVRWIWSIQAISLFAALVSTFV